MDHIKGLFAAQELILVGYSGIGTIAAVLAARRHDVSLPVTFTASLDTEFWIKYHQVSPLDGSLKPYNGAV